MQSLYGTWDWIKNLLSRVLESDSKIVQLDLLGVAVVLFSFISWLQICFLLLYFQRPLSRHAYIGFYSLAWAFCSKSGPIRTQVGLRTEQLIKQTNKQTIKQT